MQPEENDGERKTRRGMFSVQTRANGRRQKTDDGFSDTVQSNRNSRPAQAVLRQADGHAQQQSGRRVSPAQPKINGDEQRQIQDRQLVKINRQEGLQEKNDYQRAENCARTKLVYLNVRFRGAQFVRLVHWCVTGGLGLSMAGWSAANLFA